MIHYPLVVLTGELWSVNVFTTLLCLNSHSLLYLRVNMDSASFTGPITFYKTNSELTLSIEAKPQIVMRQSDTT